LPAGKVAVLDKHIRDRSWLRFLGFVAVPWDIVILHLKSRQVTVAVVTTDADEGEN
jgi:hypothetical protein